MVRYILTLDFYSLEEETSDDSDSEKILVRSYNTVNLNLLSDHFAVFRSERYSKIIHSEVAWHICTFSSGEPTLYSKQLTQRERYTYNKTFTSNYSSTLCFTGLK